MNTPLYTTYFDNLSTSDFDALQFSKDFINHQLPHKIIHLYGFGNNGKSLLLNLLSRFVSCKRINLNSDLNNYTNEYLFIQDEDVEDFEEPFNMDFWIRAFLSTNNTFILITNTQLPAHKDVHSIHLTKIVNDPNMLDKMCENLEDLKTFINNH
jgi:hypothetical protein